MWLNESAKQPSSRRKISVLQVSSSDLSGGAERIAWNLVSGLQQEGHRSWLAVGHKSTNNPTVVLIPHATRSLWCADAVMALSEWLRPLEGRVRGVWRLRRLLARFSEPRLSLKQFINWWRGHEEFNYPGTRQLLKLSPGQPDILHCHNLHGRYFDLRMLPAISGQVPTMLTLHDTWMLSGHCAYSLDCERWRTGCGMCPYLSIYPGILRDGTAYNWSRKRDIYKNCRLYVATPSNWLMEKVQGSMFLPAVKEARVIHNGVDLTVFSPGKRSEARAHLNLPQDATVFLAAANALRRNVYKDYETVRKAVEISAHQSTRRIIAIFLGDEGPSERIGSAELRWVPYQKNPQTVAQYYQAADVFLHAANADTFPNTVLESLASGVPVIATAVGGVPEQIRDGQTGFLVPVKDAAMMAGRMCQMMDDSKLTHYMGEQAAADAQARFDLNDHVRKYIEWYMEILDVG